MNVAYDIQMDFVESRTAGPLAVGYKFIEYFGTVKRVTRMPGQLHTYIVRMKNGSWGIARYDYWPSKQVEIIRVPKILAGE